MSPSTQLRALEGEIAELENAPSSIRQFRKSKLCDKAITIAKELEKDRDTQKQFYENTRGHYDDLRTENATLKRRLDEAMKELLMVKVGFEITGPSKAVEYIDHRITEIDKL